MSLIVNQPVLEKFFLDVVPSLQNDEVLIYFVFARKKYCPEIRNHHQMVHRSTFSNTDLSYILAKLKGVSTRYYDFDTGKKYKEECLSLYIDLHPKSTVKAYSQFNLRMSRLQLEILQNPDARNNFRSLRNHLMSEIHKADSRKPFIIMDVDEKDYVLLYEIQKWFQDRDAQQEVWCSETRGGYHLIFEKDNEIGKLLYQDFRESSLYRNYDIELHGQAMTPIPGTLQGGHEVKKL